MKRLCSFVAIALLVTFVQAALPSQCRGEDEKKPEKEKKKRVKDVATSGGPVPVGAFAGWVQHAPLSVGGMNNFPTAMPATLWGPVVTAGSMPLLDRSVPATLAVGNVIHVRQRGSIASPAIGNQITVRVQFGPPGSYVEAKDIPLDNSGMGRWYWEIDVYLTVRTVNPPTMTMPNSGVMSVDGRIMIEGTNATRVRQLAGTISFNPTTKNALDTTVFGNNTGIAMTSNFGLVD